ncbi:replication initiation protein [Corynebacterium suicordis]|uniref:Replication initiation protein n=1 Tax=Corynebacterium suicordis DSM 45110 TaxID=1121369 RepID=A0ABR9ZLW7_9CORY|nr:replication initiation protein [Corynebacterium suicordis]MBF4554413.1 replication initiation protein [Corynebacterium suicordis DSM 45110]MDR6278633.1 hypothetical protein [Corynebacterium suicordis]
MTIPHGTENVSPHFPLNSTDATRTADFLSPRAVPLPSRGATDYERYKLLKHLDRETLHGCPTRKFSGAWTKTKDGKRKPRLYRVESSALGRLQYVKLVHKQRATVIVLDVDMLGSAGGNVTDMAPEVINALVAMKDASCAPSWIGVNPISGKAQLIWLIDPVYADASGDSSNMRLLRATTNQLCELLGADAHFSHGFSRSPFYTGDDPTAYHWHYQHSDIFQLAALIQEVRRMNGTTDAAPTPAPKQSFTSGRELINAVKTRREEAQAYWKIAKELQGDMADLDGLDAERVDGVKVLWIAEGRAARDETAFRHALYTAHKLRAASKPMKDEVIIDAYEHAYNLAHKLGADGRQAEMPPMRDRQTMARRVRGYVLAGKSDSTGSATHTGAATSRERKALATMGRRGGKKAAERWNDRNGEYAQGRLKTLKKTQFRKKVEGTNNRQKVGQFVTNYWIETDRVPSWDEIQKETGLSRATVARHVATLKSAGEWPAS